MGNITQNPEGARESNKPADTSGLLGLGRGTGRNGRPRAGAGRLSRCVKRCLPVACSNLIRARRGSNLLPNGV